MKKVHSDSRNQTVYSKPTLCMECHLVVVMSHNPAVEEKENAWICPQCRRVYLFRYWKIGKQGRGRAA